MRGEEEGGGGHYGNRYTNHQTLWRQQDDHHHYTLLHGRAQSHHRLHNGTYSCLHKQLHGQNTNTLPATLYFCLLTYLFPATDPLFFSNFQYSFLYYSSFLLNHYTVPFLPFFLISPTSESSSGNAHSYLRLFTYHLSCFLLSTPSTT